MSEKKFYPTMRRICRSPTARSTSINAAHSVAYSEPAGCGQLSASRVRGQVRDRYVASDLANTEAGNPVSRKS